MPKVSYTPDQQASLLANLRQTYGNTIKAAQISEFCASKGLPYPYFITYDADRKVSRGVYSLAENLTAAVAQIVKPAPVAKAEPILEPAMAMPAANVLHFQPKSARADVVCVVPDRDPTYVPFGNYSDIEKIIKSRIFFPVYITGLSGNGKTMSITQACAKLNRELIRINVTEETDELDLIGGTELVDGNTVYREGAVITAMRRGACLLIDEGDLNNTKILCLMPILEGKPYFNKKTSETISPAPGFNIFITGNTKGKGSDDGRFVGTKVMNEAFLERFSITMEQEYPSAALEKKIVLKNMEQLGFTDDDFATKLCTWAEIIRKSFNEGAVDEIISTRRLVHIVKTYSIFNNRMKALTLALNRFDTETKNSFLDLYTKIDADATVQPVAQDSSENSTIESL
jgi:MoxR-like ATPase